MPIKKEMNDIITKNLKKQSWSTFFPLLKSISAVIFPNARVHKIIGITKKNKATGIKQWLCSLST